MLYVVAMPISDIADLSPRAFDILAQVDLIACEDTRRIAPLLAAHSIRTPTLSYFEHNEERRAPELVERMRRGARIALVTDAGTPAISDPGFRLVRETLDAGIRVGAIPGPSAVVAALSIAGLPTDRFSFEGFLSAKSASRRKELKALARERRTMVFFEAARRLGSALTEMVEVFGREREAVVAREIGKTYEEVVRAKLGELAARFTANPARGEITLVVAGIGRDQNAVDQADSGDLEAAPALSVEMLCEAGLSLKHASVVIASLSGHSRREVYQDALASRRRRQDDNQDD
ncbi:MAG: 16S rRNA (cytidine(1402)-2'-O)-methyltransferase [Candidatus Binataceae bacterium]